MEKHIQIHLERCDSLIPEIKNILIKTENNQELGGDEIYIKNEVEDNNECIKEESSDFEYNIDEFNHNNSNFCTVNKVTNHVNQFEKTIKIEKDVFNDCVFETELEIETPSIKPKYNTLVTEKKVHNVHSIENLNSRHLIVTRLLHNGEKQYQCNKCNKRFHDEYNLEVHKSFHENIKKFKCSTCDEQFLELSGIKSHLISHIDNNIQLFENQFFEQTCNDVGEFNSNLCNEITMLEGLKTSHSESGVPIQKRIINKVTLEFSVEFKQPNVENILSTQVSSIDSKNCVDSYLTVGNLVNSCTSTNREYVSLVKTCNASSVDQKEFKNDEMYECAKCSLLFYDRQSIIDHLKPHTDQCTNCCAYIGSLTSSKYPVSFQPGAPVYFECDDCYNEFYTLKSFSKYLSAQSKKKKDRPYKCDVCLKTFIHIYHFAAHQRLHKGERPYQCNICNKRFHTRFNLEAHMFSHQNIKRFECFLCSKKFLKLSYLKIHIMSHNSFKHECNICSEEFGSLNSLQKHQDVHSKYKPHKCIECGKSFSMLKSFEQHLKRHSGLKPYKCNLCNESCSTYFDFMCHKRIHKGEKPYKCDICGDPFTYITDWKKHRKTHYDNKIFECNECHKKFGSKNGVKYHLFTHLDRIKKHKCKVCNKKFSKKSNLYEHEKIHKDFKPYACNICKKSFISRYNFTHHLNQHTGVRPYECEFCGKTYPAVISLNRHKKTNHTCDICDEFYSNPKELKVHRTTHEESKLRQYVCKLCDKTFCKQAALNIHQLTHLVEKPFKCDICPKSFINSTVLEIHRRNHTGERPYKCKLCNKTYPQISSLTRHKATAHK